MVDKYNLGRSFRGKPKTFSKWIRNENPDKLPLKHLVSLWKGVPVKKDKPYYKLRDRIRRNQYYVLKGHVEKGFLNKVVRTKENIDGPADKDTLVSRDAVIEWLEKENFTRSKLRKLMRFWIGFTEEPDRAKPPNHAADVKHRRNRKAKKYCCVHANAMWKANEPEVIRIGNVAEKLSRQLLFKQMYCPAHLKTIIKWLKDCQKEGKLTIPAEASKPGAPKT